MDYRNRTIGCRRLEPIRPLPEAACIWWVGHALVRPGYDAFIHPVESASVKVLIPLGIDGWLVGPNGRSACGDGDAAVLRGDRPDNTTWTYAGAGEADGFLSLLVRGSWFVRAVHELIARQGNKCRIGRPALVMQLLRESSRLTTETVHRTSSACFSETIALYELLASGDECGNDSRIERVHAQLASVKPPDIAALAQEVGWTREHLTRRFAAVYGMPPVAWQRRWLIQRAAASLADGSATIKSVAAESGLPPDRFARLFHRLVGVSPSDYRDAPFPWS